jgi:hypothetical protein
LLASNYNIKITCQLCYQLLYKHNIDYFITNFREGLIIRNYITDINLPNLKIKGINTGFKVANDKEMILKTGLIKKMPVRSVFF